MKTDDTLFFHLFGRFKQSNEFIVDNKNLPIKSYILKMEFVNIVDKNKAYLQNRHFQKIKHQRTLSKILKLIHLKRLFETYQ